MATISPRMAWSRDHLVVVCGLYFTLPFGQMHSRNPRIIELARQLGRTPSSVAMKLTNFASLDSAHKARGVKGLAGHSRLDEEVWQEFANDWRKMTVLSEEKLQSLNLGEAPSSEQVTARDAVTEIMATRRMRTMQAFFRKLVLAAYDTRCCLTANPVPDLLVASHILPWSEFPSERLNPRNGLCLAAHFDRAFDRGLISFDEKLRLLVSRELKRHTANSSLRGEFISREGQPLTCPARFPPNPDFIAQHRARFRSQFD